jgi:hypothetical protein
MVSSVFLITGHDARMVTERREQIRSQIAFYASTPTYRTVLELHGWRDVGERLSRLAAAKQWGEMPALISDEILHTLAVEAAPDEVGQAIRERYTGLLDRVACYLIPFEPGRDEAFWRAMLHSLQAA